jgi:RNA polymerase sigma factor (sigma-70 family)
VEEEILSNDSLERLAVALRQLDEQDRDILVLHYYANNSLQEIANKMDLPYSVLKRRHQALLKKLRGMLGG